MLVVVGGVELVDPPGVPDVTDGAGDCAAGAEGDGVAAGEVPGLFWVDATMDLPEGPWTNTPAVGPAMPATTSATVVLAAANPDTVRMLSCEKRPLAEARNGTSASRAPMPTTGHRRPSETARNARTTSGSK